MVRESEKERSENYSYVSLFKRKGCDDLSEREKE